MIRDMKRLSVRRWPDVFFLIGLRSFCPSGFCGPISGRQFNGPLSARNIPACFCTLDRCVSDIESISVPRLSSVIGPWSFCPSGFCGPISGRKFVGPFSSRNIPANYRILARCVSDSTGISVQCIRLLSGHDCFAHRATKLRQREEIMSDQYQPAIFQQYFAMWDAYHNKVKVHYIPSNHTIPNKISTNDTGNRPGIVCHIEPFCPSGQNCNSVQNHFNIYKKYM